MHKSKDKVNITVVLSTGRKRSLEEKRDVNGKGFCLSAPLGLSMMEADVVLRDTVYLWD